MLEDITRQIKAILQNQLPAKLNQIELERADGVILEDVQSFFVQIWPEKAIRLKYPAIAILGLETTATNALSRRRELRHEVSVWIMDRVVAPDSDLSQTRLLRYVEGMERVLASDPTLGGKALDSILKKHVYLLQGGETFLKRAILYIEVLERPSTTNY